jgi:methanogenic corrinoid protein MtbC1
MISLAEEVVEEVLQGLYGRHPEWHSRYGARGLGHCRQDLHHHLEYLGTCLETGYTDPFGEYARWLASVLVGKGMTPSHLSESFEMLEQAWARRLPVADFSLVEAVLRAGIGALEESGPYEPAFYRHLPESSPTATTLTKALLAGDRVAARRMVFEPMEQGADLVDVGVSLIQPAMYEIGRLWQLSRVSIAQEHLATAISESLMAQAFAAAEFAPPIRRKALFACVQGNHHALGLRLVSDAFEVKGWEVQFLGADMPARSLTEQVDRFRPDLVGLSISMPGQIPAGREVIERVRDVGGAGGPAVLVGGLALNQLDGLWRDLGADLWSANAKAALRDAG